MLHVDVLTAYLICGFSALAGAAMLRLDRPDEARLRSALVCYVAALVTFGLGLVPAGLGLMQGRDPSGGVLAALVAGLALGLLLAQAAGAMVLGRVHAATLALRTAWAAWQGRGFVASPRNATEWRVRARAAAGNVVELAAAGLHDPAAGSVQLVAAAAAASPGQHRRCSGAC